MMQIGLIGISAGAAAALLFASVTSGSWLSVFLFYLAPLPIMIAGLGWGQWAALVAAAVAAAAVGTIFGSSFFLAFLAGAGIPAWWLGYLTLLARPGATPQAPLDWYPPGRLVVWAASLAALIVVFAIPNFGLDADSFRAGLAKAMSRLLEIETGTGTGAEATLPGGTNAKRFIDFMVVVIPPAAAVLATITSLVNLWLAGRIVSYSGRLPRPWPQLSTMSFPPLVSAALAAAVLVSFIGGLVGIVAGVVSASLTMAFGVLGFAVLHDITRGINSRAFLIGGIYASVIVFGWPMLGLCLLGFIETAIGLRARVAQKRGPTAMT